MKHIFTLALVFFSQLASASPLLDAMRAQDKTRTCSPVVASPESQLLHTEAAEIMAAMNHPGASVSVLVADCGNFAVAAMTVNTIVIPTRVARFSRQERLFVLAHELGHVAQKDVQRWERLGEFFVDSNADDDTVAAYINTLSQELELHADAYAAQVLNKLGIDAQVAAVAVFQRLEVLNAPGTPTHPAAKQRVAQLAQLTF